MQAKPGTDRLGPWGPDRHRLGPWGPDWGPDRQTDRQTNRHTGAMGPRLGPRTDRQTDRLGALGPDWGPDRQTDWGYGAQTGDWTDRQIILVSSWNYFGVISKSFWDDSARHGLKPGKPNKPIEPSSGLRVVAPYSLRGTLFPETGNKVQH